jgi:hypothetical protein
MKKFALLLETIVSMDKIIHLDELSTDDFIKFIKSFINIDSRNIEISEKIDGMNFSFGIDSLNKFFSKTKKSAPVTDPSVYGDFKFLDGIKEYHTILKSNMNILYQFKKDLAKEASVTNNFDMQIFGELLPTSQTNIVKYNSDKIGNGAIVIFDIKIDGSTILNKLYANKMIALISKKLNNIGGWKVYDKPLIKSSDFSFDVQHLVAVEDIYRKYFDIINSRKKADKETKEKAKRVIQLLIDSIKTQFIKNMLHNRKSVLGNISPEGLILRDFSTNMLIKLVDKDQFTVDNMAGSKFIKEASLASQKTILTIKNDIFGSADIMKNFAKVIEKAVDWAFTNKQINPDFKVTSLDDVLLVAYRDMLEEKRIKYSAPTAISVSVTYLEDLKNTLLRIQSELKNEKSTIPPSKFLISDEKIQRYINSVTETIDQLKSINTNSGIKVYLTLMVFCFGPYKIGELKKEFNLS